MYRQALLRLRAFAVRPVKWAPALASIVALIIALGAFFADAADTKSRLKVIEKRQDEDRQNVKETVNRIEQRMEKVDQNVQQILRKMDVIEDRRSAEERRR